MPKMWQGNQPSSCGCPVEGEFGQLRLFPAPVFEGKGEGGVVKREVVSCSKG